MLKKLLSLLVIATLVLSCIGAVSVSAEVSYLELGTFERVAYGYSMITKADPDALSVNPYGSGQASKFTFRIPYDDSDGKGAVDPMEKLMYFKFDVSDLPAEDIEFVSKVELSLYLSAWRGCTDFRIYPVKNDDWSFDDLTYNKAFGTEDTEGLFKPDEIYASVTTPETKGNATAVLVTKDITAAFVKEYAKDGILTFAMTYAYDPGNSLNIYVDTNTTQFSYGKPKLTFYQYEPEYTSDGSTYDINCSAHGRITPDDPATTDVNEADSVYSLSSNMYSLYNSDGSVPYGQDQVVYMKFPIPELESEIASATLTIPMTSQSRTWTVMVYPVSNDNWTHDTLTWNTAFSATETTNVSITVDDKTSSATGVAAPGTFGPDLSNYTYFKSVSTNGNSATVDVSFDVTPLMNSYIDDGYLTLALMLYNNTAKSYTKYCNIKCPSAKLALTTAPASIEVEKAIKIKVDGNETETFTSGILSAEAEVSSEFLRATRTTMILAVYEGNKLSKLYVSPQQKINDKNTNGGKTLLTVSSNEAIEVGENTSVSAFMWKDISLPLPLGSVKTIGR